MIVPRHIVRGCLLTGETLYLGRSVTFPIYPPIPMAASTRFCFTWHAGRVRYLFIAVFPVVCLAACSPTEAPMNARTDPEFNYRRTLPPLLQTESGSPVQSPESWREVRRPELVRLVLEHEYGIMPPPPAEIGVEVLQEDPAYLDGEAVKKLVRLTVGPPGTPTIDVLLIAPSGVQGASPVILALNFMGNHATIDDPTIPGLFGSYPFDDEGVPGRRKVVIENGVLRSYLLNTYSARKLGLETTGNASRGLSGNAGVGIGNFYIEKGSVSDDEIIRSVKSGFYVTELIGSGVSVVTGDYSRGAAGQWIENGELVYPVSEVTIAGNLRDMLMKIDAIGSDLEFRGSIASPTLLIGEMTVSGQ